MQLIYNNLDLATLGTLRILGRTTQREPAEAPQYERVTYRVRLDFFQQTFTDNFTLVQQLLAAFRSQQLNLLWNDGTVARENRTVTVAADELPSEVMTRGGTYWQGLTFSFWYYNHDVVANCLKAQCFGLDLGAVFTWREGREVTRFDDLHDARKHVAGTLSATGRYQADTTGPLAGRQAALLALKDALLAQLGQNASGVMAYGTFNRAIRIVSFTADVNQPKEYIAWNLTATFTSYPDETNYSLLDFRVDRRLPQPENIARLTVTGKLNAPSEAAARARLALLLGAIVPAGYANLNADTTAVQQGSESDNAGDGLIFTELSFTQEYRATATVLCQFQRSATNAPNLDLGTIDKFGVRYATTLFDEMRDQRRREAGQVTMEGRWFAADTLSDADKQSALTTRLAQLQGELVKSVSGKLVYGAAFNQTVRVVDFDPHIDRFGNCIGWSLTAHYTAFPNEADYATCEFKLATRNELTSGTVFKALAGEIWAPSATAAQSKLARLRAALIPAGYVLVRDHTTENRVDVESDLQTTGTNTGEGPTFIRLTIDEEFQSTVGNVLTWNLKLTTDDDVKSGFIRTTYSGSVQASANDQPTAFATALAQAQTLGSGKLPFLLKATVTENERLFQTVGAQVFVTVEFSYEYQGKGTRTYLEVTSELLTDNFGQTVETVSGFIAAPDLATAAASYTANVRNAATNTGVLILTERTPTKSYQRLDDATGPLASLDDRFSFNLQLLRAKNTGNTAINYSIATDSNVQAMEAVTQIEGQIYASTEAVARAFLDTFLVTQTLPGKRTQYNRTPEYKQGPAVGGAAPASVFVSLKFRETWVGSLTGVTGILESDAAEELLYSGPRNLEKGIPDGVSIIQQVGITAGRRTVTARCVSTTPTAAMAWVKTIRAALIVGTYEDAPRIRTAYKFLPQVTGIVTGDTVNVQVYELNATFSEILPDNPFVP